MTASAPTWSDFWGAIDLFAAPIACAAAAGLVLGFLSVYVVLRRMVFVSAAVSQCAGLGVGLAFWAEIYIGLHVPPVIVAALAAVGVTLLLAVDPRRLGMTREGTLGLAYALGAGAAVLVGDRIAKEAHDIQAILFGTAVLVRPLDLWMVLGVGALTLTLHLWWYRGMTFASFDETAARVQGLPVALLKGVLLVSIGAMVGVAARALGSLPVFAFSTLPAIAVLQLRTRLSISFGLAAAAGALFGVVGYLAAFFLQLPVGASQTAIAGAGVLVAMGLGALLRLAPGRAEASPEVASQP